MSFTLDAGRQYSIQLLSDRPSQLGKYQIRSQVFAPPVPPAPAPIPVPSPAPVPLPVPSPAPSPAPIPVDLAGNASTSAFSIGNLGNFTVQELVGSADPIDYYRFDLAQISNFTVTMDGLVAPNSMKLYYDANGNGILDDFNGPRATGSQGISISRALPSGTYYLTVESAIDALQNYTLNFLATPRPRPAFNPLFGYGLVDAAAVALATAAAPFADVVSTDVPVLGNSNRSFFWGVDRIQAPEVWAKGYLGQGITVAVIDSGVDYFNPDLSNNIWNNSDEIANNGLDDDRNGFVDDTRGWDFFFDDDTPLDIADSSHGTLVAGLIAGKNITSPNMPASLRGKTIGAAPNSSIMPIKISNNFDEVGSPIASLDRLGAGIRYAVQNGAKSCE